MKECPSDSLACGCKRICCDVGERVIPGGRKLGVKGSCERGGRGVLSSIVYADMGSDPHNAKERNAID